MSGIDTGTRAEMLSERLLIAKIDELSNKENLDETDKFLLATAERELRILRRMRYTSLDTCGKTLDELDEELSNKKLYLIDRNEYNSMVMSKRQLDSIKEILHIEKEW